MELFNIEKTIKKINWETEEKEKKILFLLLSVNTICSKNCAYNINKPENGNKKIIHIFSLESEEFIEEFNDLFSFLFESQEEKEKFKSFLKGISNETIKNFKVILDDFSHYINLSLYEQKKIFDKIFSILFCSTKFDNSLIDFLIEKEKRIIVYEHSYLASLKFFKNSLYLYASNYEPYDFIISKILQIFYKIKTINDLALLSNETYLISDYSYSSNLSIDKINYFINETLNKFRKSFIIFSRYTLSKDNLLKILKNEFIKNFLLQRIFFSKNRIYIELNKNPSISYFILQNFDEFEKTFEISEISRVLQISNSTIINYYSIENSVDFKFITNFTPIHSLFKVIQGQSIAIPTRLKRREILIKNRLLNEDNSINKKIKTKFIKVKNIIENISDNIKVDLNLVEEYENIITKKKINIDQNVIIFAFEKDIPKFKIYEPKPNVRCEISQNVFILYPLNDNLDLQRLVKYLNSQNFYNKNNDILKEINKQNIDSIKDRFNEIEIPYWEYNKDNKYVDETDPAIMIFKHFAEQKSMTIKTSVRELEQLCNKNNKFISTLKKNGYTVVNFFERINAATDGMLDFVYRVKKLNEEIDTSKFTNIDLWEKLRNIIKEQKENYPNIEFVINPKKNTGNFIIKGDNFLFETIILELLTNAKKYAFPNNKGGNEKNDKNEKIIFMFEYNKNENKIILYYENNGKKFGLSKKQFILRKRSTNSTGLGGAIIGKFVADLNGEFNILSQEKGTKFEFIFNKN